MRNILSRVPFAEHAEAAGLADPDTLRQWAATALFTADIPTADIATAPALQIRPLVRATVWSLTELERDELVRTEYGAYPTEAAARMTECLAAVKDAPSWPLMHTWQVAK